MMQNMQGVDIQTSTTAQSSALKHIIPAKNAYHPCEAYSII